MLSLLGNFMEGRVWIEDENGQATALLETKSGQKLLRGTWVDMHDKPFRSMLGNITCLRSIAETCGLLPHIRLKHTNISNNFAVLLVTT